MNQTGPIRVENFARPRLDLSRCGQRRMRTTTKEMPRPQYSNAMLERLANNEVSYYEERELSPKKSLILSSMRGTFLCSNYLRFQPLLNVFE